MVTIARRAALGGITLLLARPVRAIAPILPEPSLLPPDGFSWQPETAPQGPVLVLVSIVEQVARSDALNRLALAPPIAEELREALVPGASLYCALGSATADSRTGPGFTVAARPA